MSKKIPAVFILAVFTAFSSIFTVDSKIHALSDTGITGIEISEGETEVDVDSDFVLDDAIVEVYTENGRTYTTYNIALIPEWYWESIQLVSQSSSKNNVIQEDVLQENSKQNGSMSLSISNDYSWYGQKYLIKNVILKDGGGNAVNKLVNGGTVESVTIATNFYYFNTSDIAAIALAKYDGGVLSDIVSYSVDLEDYIQSYDAMQYSVLTELGYDLDNIDENTSVKLFLWTSLDGLRPYSAQFTAYPQYTLNVTVKAGGLYSLPVYKTGTEADYLVTFDTDFFEFADSGTLAAVKSGNTRVSVREYVNEGESESE
jgi:hypothetical protein